MRLKEVVTPGGQEGSTRSRLGANWAVRFPADAVLNFHLCAG